MKLAVVHQFPVGCPGRHGCAAARPFGPNFMDALGALSGLGALKNLIPNLTFVGVYSKIVNKETVYCPLPSWKFGIATIAADKSWSGSGEGIATPVTTILIAPNMIAHPGMGSAAEYGVSVRFKESTIEMSRTGAFVALIFNY